MAAILVQDHGYPLHLVPHLNGYIARHVFLSKQRDRHGNLVLRQKGRAERLSPREEFARHWRRYGLAEHHIRVLWQRQHGAA